MARSLRIGIVAAHDAVVPPERYGGIEWAVSILAEGLLDAGHEVTLFAAPASATTAELVAPGGATGDGDAALRHVLGAWAAAAELDLVSDHSGLLAAAMADACPVPMVHTVHTPLDGARGELYRLAARVSRRLRLISVSAIQEGTAPDLPWVGTCPNALDLDAYPFYEGRREGYLFFLGRLSPEKGAADAVRVSRKMGLPLKLAGKMHDRAERAYFAREVQPYLGDGIEYLGEVSHEEKVQLLQRARCTLFPLAWEEPFGLAILESLACGTPVVAVDRGAVREVIAHGESGIVVESVDDMAAAVEAAELIEPAACRDHVESRFSEQRMVRAYQDAFDRLLAGA